MSIMLDDRPPASTVVPRHGTTYQRMGSPYHRPASSHHQHHHPLSRARGMAHYSSYRDTNFRHAAPFLSGVTSYMERHGVPFEHVDVWVPSAAPSPSAARDTTAPLVTSYGSGSAANLAGMVGEGGIVGVAAAAAGEGKLPYLLCFGGSATLGTQIVDGSTSRGASIGDVEDGARGGVETKGPPPERTVVPLTDDEMFNLSLFGDYSEMFSFSTGCGLPGRVFQSGVATWEQYLANAPPEMFERRGGAMQFGIRTALGLPIESPNAGRIVLVLYSRHNRNKDEGLVARMVRDMRLMNPCPRWRLMVESRPPGAGGNVAPAAKPPSIRHPMPTSWPSSSPMQLNSMVVGDAGPNHPASPYSPDCDKSKRINNLIVLLHENMPTDLSSPLGAHLNSMMSLRMLLLGRARAETEEELVETVLVLHESYIAAGRPGKDVALLVVRDYEFHTQHQQTVVVAAAAAPPAILQGPPRQLMTNNFNHMGAPQQQMMNNSNSAPSSLNPLGSFIPRTMFQ
jgi:hypothetical protein